MKLVTHSSGSSPCNGPAFYSKKMYGFGCVPGSKQEDILLLDGSSKPPLGEILLCGTCGKPWSTYEEAMVMITKD